MFMLFIFIAFVVQSVSSDNHDVKQCAPEGTQWSSGNTIYFALNYKGELYAYPFCKAGFAIRGSVKVRCVNGWWESPLPQCDKITSQKCEMLRLPENLIRNCEEGAPAVGKACHFRCREPYQFIGSLVRRCLSNLRWSGATPRCVLYGTRTKFVPSSSSHSTFVTTAPEIAHPAENSSNRNNHSINPCSINNGGCDHKCKLLNSAIECFCHAGYRLENRTKCRANQTHSVSTFGHSSFGTTDPPNPHLIDNSFHGNILPTNPCSINKGGCEHRCSFLNGSIRCACSAGYRLENGTKCKDIDECIEGRHRCTQICHNTVGKYQCSCRDGYTIKGDYECQEIERTAEITGSNFGWRNYSTANSTNSEEKAPMDPCKINNGGCHQICDSSPGYASCSCYYGYRLQRNGICADIDECIEGMHRCTHNCHNTVGRYQCSCRNGYILVGDYDCKDIDECRNTRRNLCSHKCNNIPGSFRCSCEPGYYLRDGYNCEDIDECQRKDANLCNQHCHNTEGSYNCSCRLGYVLKNKHECEDIDECQRKDMNLCNQRCHNTEGSYNCSCRPGYVLKNKHECEGCRKGSYRPEGDIYCKECPPNSYTVSEAKSSLSDCICAPGFVGDPFLSEPCEDVDECAENNFGCSNICINTPGSAHCSCPLGFQLKEDNKTCVDIDECKIKNGGCQMICRNSVGNFSCHCTNGYFLSEDGYSCDDADECAVNNGGCSDLCINFPSGYYCSCPKGYRLDVAGKTCIAVRCSSLAVPQYSTMKCNPKNVYEIINPNDAPSEYPMNTVCRIKCRKGYNLSTSYGAIKCLENGNWNSSTPECIVSNCPPVVAPENGDVYPPICTEGPISVKQQCYFTCNAGYHLTEKRQIVKCQNNLQWSANIQPSCEADKIIPVINCPDDITIELKANESWAYVTIPEPETNMEDIEIFPDWISIAEPIVFSGGKTDILFKVSDVRSNATAACILTVHIVDKDPPSFVLCPDSMKVDSIGSIGTVVEWEEPRAVDNVGVKSISKNLEPNSRLPAGVHHVEYMATDEAGNIARCSFKINVSRGHCGNLDDPENGKANCIDWLLGKLCRPSCEPGYTREPDDPKFYACGDTGIWTPSDTITPCLLNFPNFVMYRLNECVNGTRWSPITGACEEIDLTSNYTTIDE